MATCNSPAPTPRWVPLITPPVGPISLVPSCAPSTLSYVARPSLMLLDFDSKVLQPSDDPYAQGAFACSSTSSPVASPTVSTSQSPPLSSLPPSPAPATG